MYHNFAIAFCEKKKEQKCRKFIHCFHSWTPCPFNCLEAIYFSVTSVWHRFLKENSQLFISQKPIFQSTILYQSINFQFSFTFPLLYQMESWCTFKSVWKVYACRNSKRPAFIYKEKDKKNFFKVTQACIKNLHVKSIAKRQLIQLCHLIF